MNITNGLVDLNPNTLQGSVATYTCSVGHELSGNATRTCQSLTGAWSGAEPTCNRKSAILMVAIKGIALDCLRITNCTLNCGIASC